MKWITFEGDMFTFVSSSFFLKLCFYISVLNIANRIAALNIIVPSTNITDLR